MNSKQEASTERTAGPWRVEHDDSRRCWTVFDEGDEVICRVAFYDDERRAGGIADSIVSEHNAHDALVAALREVAEMSDERGLDPAAYLVVLAAIGREARAALAQAEGTVEA